MPLVIRNGETVRLKDEIGFIGSTWLKTVLERVAFWGVNMEFVSRRLNISNKTFTS